MQAIEPYQYVLASPHACHTGVAVGIVTHLTAPGGGAMHKQQVGRDTMRIASCGASRNAAANAEMRWGLGCRQTKSELADVCL